jgi:hypothetical protein
MQNFNYFNELLAVKGTKLFTLLFKIFDELASIGINAFFVNNVNDILFL